MRLRGVNLETSALLAWSVIVLITSLTNPRVLRVGVSTYAFLGLGQLVRKLPVPQVVAEGSESKVSLFQNTITSLVHATVVGIMTVAVILTELDSSFNVPWLGDVTPNPLIHAKSEVCQLILSTTTGYFAYDLWDILRVKMHHTAPHLVLHHVVLLFCFTVALQQEVCLPFLVLPLMAELNSVGLHSRGLLKACKVLHSTSRPVKAAYWAVWGYLWVTFVLTRTAGHAVVFAQVYFTHFEQGWQGWVALFGMVVFNVLNLDLAKSTYKAFRQDIKLARGEKVTRLACNKSQGG
eukprot:TRINITY_DN1340_c0_g2_i1.p1 TRINITY_DN1340_c0_g2~~TRINITY_DN1340_c0_g2_i1.p1  ORF type:complete len:293 (+),score=44.00 TRINITY_DN1340_c0_g2_i1:194-1072(+)